MPKQKLVAHPHLSPLRHSSYSMYCLLQHSKSLQKFPQTLFAYYKQFSEYGAIISPDSISQLVFIMETQCVSFEAGTEFLNIIWKIRGKKIQTLKGSGPLFSNIRSNVLMKLGGSFMLFPFSHLKTSSWLCVTT
jgi:hypothetical protein